MVNLWIPCWKHCTSKLRRQSSLFYTWTRKPLRLHSSPLEFRQRQWSNAFQSKAAGELETSKGFLILWTLSISSFLTTFSEHGGCLQVQDLALSVKLHEILDCPPLEHVQVPLDGSREGPLVNQSLLPLHAGLGEGKMEGSRARLSRKYLAFCSSDRMNSGMD